MPRVVGNERHEDKVFEFVYFGSAEAKRLANVTEFIVGFYQERSNRAAARNDRTAVFVDTRTVAPDGTVLSAAGGPLTLAEAKRLRRHLGYIIDEIEGVTV